MENFYQTHIFCCVNKRDDDNPTGCCSSKGSVQLQNYLKSKVKEAGIEKTRVNSSLCLGRCALGPVMVIYPDGIWYNYQNEQDIDEILREHLQLGKVVTRLQLKQA